MGMPTLFSGPLLLTTDRRKRFNVLVDNIDKAIDEAVDDIDKNSKVKYEITKAHGNFKGWYEYKVFYSDYKLHGAGWFTWDKGEDTVRSSIKGCQGLGITARKCEVLRCIERKM